MCTPASNAWQGQAFFIYFLVLVLFYHSFHKSHKSSRKEKGKKYWHRSLSTSLSSLQTVNNSLVSYEMKLSDLWKLLQGALQVTLRQASLSASLHQGTCHSSNIPWSVQNVIASLTLFLSLAIPHLHPLLLPERHYSHSPFKPKCQPRFLRTGLHFTPSLVF